jgi:hypothetical protein
MIWTLSLAAKSTLVLGAATVATWALGRSSASTRHAVWHVALLSLVALPVLSAALPRLELPLFEPASGVAEARLYFTSAADERSEYWVEMTRNGSRVVGRLPKPRMAASPVRYRIEARGRDGRVASTERYLAVVAADESRCPKDARVAPMAASTEAVTVHSSVSR